MEIVLSMVVVVTVAAVKVIFDARRERQLEQAVNKAEEGAYYLVGLAPGSELEPRLKRLAESEAGLKEKTEELNALIEESRSALSTGRLFNLYSKQIEKYQEETRSRATWSFIFALVAMFAGLGFVFWGGTLILTQVDLDHVAAGAAIASIGGGINAFITKTFLDVHKLSLSQLNHYFQQPVINDHILMAQRLADEVDDEETRKKAYETVIGSISKLIDMQLKINTHVAETEPQK